MYVVAVHSTIVGQLERNGMPRLAIGAVYEADMMKKVGAVAAEAVMEARAYERKLGGWEGGDAEDVNVEPGFKGSR